MRKKNKAWDFVAFSLAAAFMGSWALADSPHRNIDSINWPADYAGAAGPQPSGSLATVNATYLPVLIPKQFFGFKSLTFVGEQLSYTASVKSSTFSAMISGTRVSFNDDGDGPPLGPGIVAGLGEQSAYATFSRYGAGYNILVECRSAADPRCANTKFVETLAGAVDLVGGSKGDPASASPSGAGAPLPPAAPDPNFRYEPAGVLLPGSGRGVATTMIYAPGIRFPVEKRRAYLNSQVWGIGGASGPRGSWADPRNYAYPWHDNFCETRSRATPACPGGKGHQGVDIRPDAPDSGKARRHWAVAAEEGRISYIGSYSVTLTGSSGTQYRYLHMQSPVAVKLGQLVSRGERMGLISNNFGGTATTIHLHFEMLQNHSGAGLRHVPPYTSLVEAYRTFN